MVRVRVRVRVRVGFGVRVGVRVRVRVPRGAPVLPQEAQLEIWGDMGRYGEIWRDYRERQCCRRRRSLSRSAASSRRAS